MFCISRIGSLCAGGTGMRHGQPLHHIGTWDFSIPTRARQRAGCARGWLKQLIRILAALSTVVLTKLSPIEIWPWTAIVELLLSISSPKGCFIPHWDPICVVLEQSKLSLPQHSQCRKSPEIAYRSCCAYNSNPNLFHSNFQPWQSSSLIRQKMGQRKSTAQVFILFLWI